MSEIKLEGYKVLTLCDFGEPNRVDILVRHKTFATAFRDYPKTWLIYGRLHSWRVWLETVEQYQKRVE